MERPILFNTEMVRAILEGRKTQTRRIVKPQPSEDLKFIGYVLAGSNKKDIGSAHFVDQVPVCSKSLCCKPPCKPKDILYVRETWQESECFDYNIKGEYVFKANESDEEFAEDHNINWRPSIHMPKKAARLFLKVTNVKAERLQDITEEDAKAEGTQLLSHDGKTIYTKDYKSAFKVLWDKVYKFKNYGWNENPWVWVIEFERIER